MAETIKSYKIQQKTSATDVLTLHPETDADLVVTTAEKQFVSQTEKNKLSSISYGAQVNVVEEVRVNGTALTPTSKVVDVTLSIEKQETADDNYSATYYLKANGTQSGSKINIPKDLVVSSASVKTCTTVNSPVTGYAVGDKYIDMNIANSEEHLYILVSDLVDQIEVVKNGTGGVVTDVSEVGNVITVTMGTVDNDFLPDSGVTAGTYSVVAVNSKGVVTAGGKMIQVGDKTGVNTPTDVVIGGLFFEEL